MYGLFDRRLYRPSCPEDDGVKAIVFQNTEFEEIKAHLDDLLRWIEQIEKCAEAAGNTATYPYCLQTVRRYVLT
jgi:hypothetical protein